MIGTMVAAQNPKVAFLMLLAGTVEFLESNWHSCRARRSPEAEAPARRPSVKRRG